MKTEHIVGGNMEYSILIPIIFCGISSLWVLLMLFMLYADFDESGIKLNKAKIRGHLKKITFTSRDVVTAFADYLQEDETDSLKQTNMIMADSIPHTTLNTDYEKSNAVQNKISSGNNSARNHPQNFPVPKPYFEDRGQFRIFLCHAKEDFHNGEAFRDTLARHNYDVWFDNNNLDPGDKWENEIQKAIGMSDVFLICVSSSWTKKKDYIHAELRMALDEAKKMPEGATFILPVRFEECQVPWSLRNIQYIDLFKDSHNNLTKLLKTLESLRTAKRVTQAVKQ